MRRSDAGDPWMCDEFDAYVAQFIKYVEFI